MLGLGVDMHQAKAADHHGASGIAVVATKVICLTQKVS